jgi:hypothetical protein
MKKRALFLGTFGAIGLAVLLPSTVFAHGFADRYDLPVPLGLYVSAAGAVVVLSFVLIGIFAKRDFGVHYPKINLREWKVGRGLAHPVTVEVVRALSAFTFAVYLLAGLFGTEDPNENLVPTMTWIVFWVGIAYVSALIGNIWALINPWKIIFGYAESLIWKSSRRDLARYEPYPERLSAWPAVVFFLVFDWVEVVYTGSGVPLNIAAHALVYSAITFVGMWWFGRDEWLRNGEVFTIVFGFLAAFAPVQITEPSGDDDMTAHGFSLGPWGAGLLTAPRPELSKAALLVLMLATVSFDGFVETGTWTELLLSLLPAFSFLGAYAFTGITTMGLILVPIGFFGVFALTAWLMGWLGNSSLSSTVLVRTFVFSLVPIALAYHIAHFFSFLMIQGQRMFSLISDPFGWGWDLFGTADYVIDIGAVNARFIWFLSIVAIVIGHIVAVYVAHVYALRTFPDKGDAVRSQYPMLVLMAGYTMVSLWIVAQPIMAA